MDKTEQKSKQLQTTWNCVAFLKLFCCPMFFLYTYYIYNIYNHITYNKIIHKTKRKILQNVYYDDNDDTFIYVVMVAVVMVRVSFCLLCLDIIYIKYAKKGYFFSLSFSLCYIFRQPIKFPFLVQLC